MNESWRLAAVAVAAAAGGAVNSVAGGGMLITFPALVWLGVPPIVANATSTVALWPGALSSMWGYRTELAGAQAWATRFSIPSIIGGVIGAALLVRTPPDRFERLVPWLVLAATALFVAQPVVMRMLRQRTAPSAATSGDPDVAASPAVLPPARFLWLQLAVAIYGGYFGGGAGIIMLAALGMMGFTNIHRMNGLKNWAALCFNGVAAAMFAFGGLVDWPIAGVMAVGATAGGYLASGMAQRVPQSFVRAAVGAIGATAALWMWVRA